MVFKRTEQSDHSIILKILNGDSGQFELLMRRYNQRLFRIGISYLKDEHLVEDILQNTYIKAFKALGNFNFSASFSTWLTRILINECLQVLRKRKQEDIFDIYSESAELLSSSESGEEKLIKEEMKVAFEKAVLNLPEKYRTIYMMRNIEEYSTGETADILQISESNVKIRLHRAKEILKEELIRNAETIDAFHFGSWKCDRHVQRVMTNLKIDI